MYRIDKSIGGLFVLAALALLMMLPAAFSQSWPDPGHPASQIGGGTFNSSFGVFTFPQNLTVTNNVSSNYFCLGGDCRNTWPSFGITDCTDVNDCTIIAEDTYCSNDYLLDGNGDCWAISASGLCSAGVCGGGHTHTYDNYNDWNLLVNDSKVKDITTGEDVGFDDGLGFDISWDGSRDVGISFDCSDIAGTDLGCSGEQLYVSTDFEEETHCSEHDGTGTSCSGELLNMDTTYQGTDSRCTGSNYYLDGNGNCDSGYLDADGVDAVNDAVYDVTSMRACETDPQVNLLTANLWCSANAAATAVNCTVSAPVTACSSCDSRFLNDVGDISAEALTSDMNWDANTFVISYDDNRIGIGTASPASNLSVGGAGSSSYMMTAYYDASNYAYIGGASRGAEGHGSTYGVYSYGDMGVYADGATSYAVYGTTSAGLAGVYATGGAYGALNAEGRDGNASIYSYGTFEVEYGGLCTNPSSYYCSSFTDNDGDVYVTNGGLCVDDASCSAPSAGEVNISEALWINKDSGTYTYLYFGNNGSAYLRYYYVTGTFYFRNHTGSAAAISVDGCLPDAVCDIAEHASASKEEELEPGEILVISSDDGSFDVTKSAGPYSSGVAGVFSTGPGIYMGDKSGNPVSGGLQIGNVDHFANMTGTEHNGTVPLALAGQVPVKVCLENGPIVKGDRITTSSFPGHGMRWSLDDLSKAESFDDLRDMIAVNELRRGAVVGKALEGFDGTNSTYQNHLGQPCGKIRLFLSLE